MEHIYSNESYLIFGALFEVHKHLGAGLNEKIYQEALAMEFRKRGIPFEREKHLPIMYDGIQLSVDYIADFVCYNKIIIELKSVEKILPIHKAQLINYLNITHFHLGILVNFNAVIIDPIRITR